MIIVNKKIFKTIAFFLIFCVLLTILSRIFDGGRLFSQGWIYDRTARYAAFSEEIPEQIGIPPFSEGGDITVNGRTIHCLGAELYMMTILAAKEKIIGIIAEMFFQEIYR